MQDEKESLQEQIDELEEQVDNLTHDLAEASYIDISNYAVTMKTSFEYTGKVTVKKGLKKGTYEIRVKVTAAGNAIYDKVTKTVTFKIKVK